MDHRINTLLADIEKAIKEIDTFFNSNEIIFSQFCEDIKTKRAVERDLEIIGEAISKILTIDKAVPISDARKIVDMRNRIIHGYDTVSDEVVWGIIIKYLPRLKLEIDTILNNSSNELS